MCTLVVASHVVPGHPLVVVANRDELRARASSPPMRWPAGFVAPRDEVAGGTWLGYTERGVFVAITNRYLGPRDPSRASRGAIVLAALEVTGSARDIHEAMKDLDPRAYNGFHLVYADGHDVLATISDGQTLAQMSLGHGVRVITERSFSGQLDRPRRDRILRRWDELAMGWRTAPFEPHLVISLLVEHDNSDPLGATCIHLDAMGYGTRSAAVFSTQDTRSTLLWAEGPPCTTPFEEVKVLAPALSPMFASRKSG